MFEYAVEALHMSENEAYVRLRAAQVAREFPLVLQMLEENELHLTAIKLLAPLLTQANHVDVLSRAKGRSKREVERLVAELAPKPDVPSVVRKLPAARPSARVVAPPAGKPAAAELPVQQFRLETPPQVTTPLSPGRYKVQFTATQGLHDKLQQLKDLMRHQVPDGVLCVIVERAADLLIEQQMKRRFAQTQQPRQAALDAARKAKPPSRYTRREVVREVYRRDAGQCTFVSPEGRRCTARGHLELHHDDPYARGGQQTVGKLEVVLSFTQRTSGRAGFRPRLHAKQAEAARPGLNEPVARPRGTPGTLKEHAGTREAISESRL